MLVAKILCAEEQDRLRQIARRYKTLGDMREQMLERLEMLRPR
jgi:hypothetical protein